MIKNLQMFNPNGTILAYKNLKGKGAALAEFIVAKCLEQGKLSNKKLIISSSGNLAVKFAKACKENNIDFFPMIGAREDIVATTRLTELGFQADRTPFTERDAKVAELQSQGWFYFDQFADELMIDYYKSEAEKALSELGTARPDIYIDFIGSGATFRGFYEVLKDICPCAYANSCYKDETKFERKDFIRDLIKSGEVTLLDVQSSFAGNLAVRYSMAEFGTPESVQRTFFTSLQAALNWLEINSGKTALLYWED